MTGNPVHLYVEDVHGQMHVVPGREVQLDESRSVGVAHVFNRAVESPNIVCVFMSSGKRTQVCLSNEAAVALRSLLPDILFRYVEVKCDNTGT